MKHLCKSDLVTPSLFGPSGISNEKGFRFSFPSFPHFIVFQDYGILRQQPKHWNIELHRFNPIPYFFCSEPIDKRALKPLCAVLTSSYATDDFGLC